MKCQSADLLQNSSMNKDVRPGTYFNQQIIIPYTESDITGLTAGGTRKRPNHFNVAKNKLSAAVDLFSKVYQSVNV